MAPVSFVHAVPTVLAAGQGAKQMGELGLAFALSTLIGLEREWRQKSAGLRTHTLVGVGAALFMLVSSTGSATCSCPAGPSSTRRASPPRSCPASASSAAA
jgi:uncharacterized membrane protein YhiD involved in acid resistance